MIENKKMEIQKMLKQVIFDLYMKNIVLDLNDWIEERTDDVDDLTIELLTAELVESLFPIQVFLDNIPNELFTEKEIYIDVPCQNCSIDLDMEERCVRLTIATIFQLNCVGEFNEDTYTAWRARSQGFNTPALILKFGVYVSDSDSDISPNFSNE